MEIPALGAIPLSQLTPQDLQTYYGEKLASGRRDGKGGLSPRTVRHHHVTVGNQQKWDTFVAEVVQVEGFYGEAGILGSLN